MKTKMVHHFIFEHLKSGFDNVQIILLGVGIHAQLVFGIEVATNMRNAAQSTKSKSFTHDFANYDSATKQNAQVTIPGYLAT